MELCETSGVFRGCQVWALLVFLVFLATYVAFVVPLFRNGYVAYTLAIIQGITGVIMTVFYLFTSCLDPSDPGLKGVKDEKKELYCTICKVRVGNRSKHCRKCDRCVDNFDHHCRWLNNCIGQINYRPFLGLLAFSFSFILLQFLQILYLLIISFIQQNPFRAKILSVYAKQVHIFGIQIWYVLILIALLFTLKLIGELILFHIVMLQKQLTTYEYIVGQQQKGGGQGGVLDMLGFCNIKKQGKGVYSEHSNGSLQRSEYSVKLKKVALNPCAALGSKVHPMNTPFNPNAVPVGDTSDCRRSLELTRQCVDMERMDVTDQISTEVQQGAQVEGQGLKQ